MVELRPSKSDVAGSSPVSRSAGRPVLALRVTGATAPTVAADHADVAQVAGRRLDMPDGAGSSPAIRTPEHRQQQQPQQGSATDLFTCGA